MDKNTLLNTISQEQIFCTYLGISEISNKNISSPFTEDKKPSFNLYYKDSKLLYKCHSTGYTGDCFQLVADILKLDIKSNFQEIISNIKTKCNVKIPIKITAAADSKKEYKFEIYDKFSESHLAYWSQANWSVSSDILDLYNVKPLKFLSFLNSENKITQLRFTNKFGFVYLSSDSTSYEFYIPKQSSFTKFYLNAYNGIFGYDQIQSDVDYIIICAGKKDCLILNSNGFNAVTFRSENHNITQHEIDLLKLKTKKLFICYDNDAAGINAMHKNISLFSELISISLPSSTNDVADYFIPYTSQDFRDLVSSSESIYNQKKNESSTEFTIFDQVEKYLNKHYHIRFNNLKIQYEIALIGSSDYKVMNTDKLYIEMQRKGIKVSIRNLESIIKSDIFDVYNPLLEYFKALPKYDDRVDYIDLLASHVECEDSKTQESFNYHFKKWLVRSVKCATIDNYFNKQAFVLVHTSSKNDLGQNSGKTTFCRFLCPPSLSDYIAEDFSNDKDARIMLAKNFLINLDELAALSRKEINQLKTWFSKTQINERLPYDKTNSILPRRASFIGSTNQDTFLTDETGSVRWLCFKIKSIDWSYKKKINIDNVYSQAIALAKSGFDAELSNTDIYINEKNNAQFFTASIESELIAKHFTASDSSNKDAHFLTSTEICIMLEDFNFKLSSNNVGKAMNGLGFKRVKNYTLDRYGYYCLVSNRLESKLNRI